MSPMMPKGEALRKAVKWISERREAQGGVPLYRILEEASLKFNLSPSDQEFLQRFFQKEG
jgi:hypothetical protein